MSDQDMFDRILASLHDAMLDETYWPATSALIDEACGTQGNALMVGEGPPDDIRALFIGLYYRGERRADLEREYLTVYHPIDERVPRIRQLPDSHLVYTPALYTAEELPTSRVYNEMLPRLGAQESLNVRLDGPDGSHIAWGIGDPVTRGGWASPQLALIKGLLPHIRQFVRVQQALAKAEARGVSATGLLDTPRIGVLYLDRRGRIVEANDRARALLRQGDGVTDQAGELRAREPADHARLARLVAAALPTDSIAVSGSMLLRRATGLPPFVVHVKPVVVRQPDFGAKRVAALVLMVEPGRQSRIDPALVAAALGLSPAESQVAVWLAEGQSVREMAAAAGVREKSIHYHLHEIYQKRGLARQADLVRLVLSLVELA